MPREERYRPAKTLAEKRHRMFSAIIPSLAVTAAILLALILINISLESLPRWVEVLQVLSSSR